MKNILPAIFFTLVNCAIAINASGQPSGITDTVPKENSLVLPPLVQLIDSALKYNPLVHFRTLEIKAKESNLKSQRTNWTRNLGIQADTRYGTFDNYSSNVNGQSTSILATTSRQFNYGVGMYMKFPLIDMLDRKNLVNKAKVEVEQAKSMAEMQQDELRQTVIRQYQDVLLKQRLLHIKSQSLGSAKVNMEMVEKQFRNGIIAVSEYVRISDIAARSESDFQIAETEFILAKMILEEIIGFTLPVAPKNINENN
jgi:outer membrane protein TolC